ncbi:MAG TPA: hypothetical protein VII98_14290 [Solirubrobacteraceae bacterium]
MPPTPRPTLLRPGVLDGVVLVHAGGAEHIAAACGVLGARTTALDADLLDEEATITAAQALAGADMLVCDTGAAFREKGGTPVALQQALQRAWNATRSVVNAAQRPDGGGRVVLIAPRPGDGPEAGAARAALENLARSTSVEWARFGVRVIALWPGEGTGDDVVADLVGYLASPAGGYFSGCVLELGVLAGPSASS